MSTVSLIFPHQLYKHQPALKTGVDVYIIEEYLFFKQYHFHQQKLLLHRASMKKYADELIAQKHTVHYIEAGDEKSDIRKLIPYLAKQKVSSIIFTDVVDDWLTRRIKTACRKHTIEMEIKPSPNFLNTIQEVQTYFDQKKTYFQTAFYIEQRKQRNILLTANGEPEGGHWSYDADNRLKYPKKEKPPKLKPVAEDEYVKEAREYVSKHFSENYGSVDAFIYPTDHKMAEQWLTHFLHERFEKFGVYEDALVTNEHFLHHSVLTPMLNIGLLSPKDIIDKAISYVAKNKIPLNSLEGFIRQVMGWREFIRIVYEREGRKQRTKNFWGFERKIPKSFWNGTTGIFPVDNVIKKVLQTGYSHHIERLMVMGNFMLLCEFDPDEVYKWFMEMYVDAYDWVMVPNVYGMTQFADGGLMTTKPYISGSNYLLKMSDYPKGEWTTIWDGLFWRFLQVNRNFFAQNQRWSMLIKTLDKMPADKKKQHIQVADNFLNDLDISR